MKDWSLQKAWLGFRKGHWCRLFSQDHSSVSWLCRQEEKLASRVSSPSRWMGLMPSSILLAGSCRSRWRFLHRVLSLPLLPSIHSSFWKSNPLTLIYADGHISYRIGDSASLFHSAPGNLHEMRGKEKRIFKKESLQDLRRSRDLVPSPADPRCLC